MTSRHMSDGASMRVPLSRRDMTYRTAGADEPLIHPLFERPHDRRGLFRDFLLHVMRQVDRLVILRTFK